MNGRTPEQSWRQRSRQINSIRTATGNGKTLRPPIAERNHPKPQGFWSVKRDAAADRLIWRDSKWEPYVEDPGPRHVVDTWKPKPAPKVRADVLRDHIERLAARKRYWDGVKGRPVVYREYWRRLPDQDDLDRLATSAAIEAGL